MPREGIGNRPNNPASAFNIIGGGGSGAMVAIYLAQRLAGRDLNGETFNLFDPNGFGSGGVAYGQAWPGMILNSVETEMSPWEPPKFKNHFSPLSGPSFAPRGDGGYRDFLRSEVNAAIAKLRGAGACVNFFETEARPEASEDRFIITDKDGQYLTDPVPAGNIVLCAGYGPNKYFRELIPYMDIGFVHSLYEDFNPVAIDNRKEKNVIFIGSGPALDDCVNALQSDPGSFNLVVVSPTGKPLDVRDLEAERDEKNITPAHMLNLEKVTSESLAAAISADIDEAIQAGATRRRASLDILNQVGSALKAMDIDEAHKFDQLGILSRLKHWGGPKPLENAVRLEQFRPRYIAHRLRPEEVEVENGRFILKIGNETFRPDFIINGTGHGRHNAPVLEYLKSQGKITVAPGTGVLATDEDEVTLTPSGLLCVGPAAHTGMDGMESFAPKAEKVAVMWTRQISRNSWPALYAS